jgi:hypothetical protein
MTSLYSRDTQPQVARKREPATFDSLRRAFIVGISRTQEDGDCSFGRGLCHQRSCSHPLPEIATHKPNRKFK